MTLALQNPKRRIRKLLLTENAARRLEEDGIKTRVTPEIVRPGQIDALLTPDWLIRLSDDTNDFVLRAQQCS